MTNKTRIKQATQALKKQDPAAGNFIALVDENGIATVNGETMTEAEFNRRYPGKHTVIRLGVRLSEI